MSKAAPSDAIRDPSKDLQVDAMVVDGTPVEHKGASIAAGTLLRMLQKGLSENLPNTAAAVLLEPDSSYCNFCGCKVQTL